MKKNTFTLALPALLCACVVPNPALQGDDDDTEATTDISPETTDEEQTTAPDPDDESGGPDETTGGPDETTGGPHETTGGPDETTTGAPTCVGAGLQCVPAVPNGWHGPVARMDDTEAPDADSCAGAYAASVASGATSVVDPGVSCDCSCAAPEGGSCSSTIDVRVYDVSCGTTCNANYGSCASLTTTLDNIGQEGYVDDDFDGIRLLPFAPNVTQNPSCDPVANHVIPELELSYLEVCAPEAALDETCSGDEVCVPTPSLPFSAASCIWAEGDLECPGDYSEREILHREIEDTRSCSECSCGSAANVECEGEIGVSRLWDGHIELPTMYPANGNCGDRLEPDDGIFINGDVTYAVSYDAPEPTSTGCPASGGDAFGSATGSDPITICCLAQ